MTTYSTNLKNVFKEDTTVQTGISAVIEYNMNSLIDGIKVTSAIADTAYKNQIKDADGNVADVKTNPFSKLFPVDSIVKPFRPLNSGIKYFIIPPIGTNYNFPSPTKLTYDSTKPRVYYPGYSTFYKYWISPKNTNADLTVTYKVSGSTVAGNKAALANKIIIRFEKNHSLPSQYRVTVTPSTGSSITTSYYTPASNGECVLYYNGTTWTNVAPTEPVSYSNPQLINSIKLEATNSNTGESIAVIELSARWVKDISSDLVSFEINKESSSSSDGILPVGTVTANSLILECLKYDQDELKYVNYNRESTAFDSSLIYLNKNIEIKTYIDVYHANGAITSGLKKYDRVPQGTFYINDFSISQYGDVSINALDGAKYLMEVVAPDMLCESYAVTAILRRLLDSVGFTNYSFNLATTETSVPSIRYWWTDGTQSVWENIQEICRDIQMNAFFDENNILQFYSRDYIYDKSLREVSWDFYYEKELDVLPNIVDFSQKEVAAANSVKVLWSVPIVSNYIGSSGPLWESPTSFLSAGVLGETIEASTSAALTKLVINDTNIDPTFKQQVFYNYSGYVLIDSEIIEYDGIWYEYTPIDGSAKVRVLIKSAADIDKYKALSKPGYAIPGNPETSYFKPTGEYNVKTRGAFGTTPAYHAATALDQIFYWDQYTNNGEGKVASFTSVPLDQTKVSINKSYMTVSNNNASPLSYSFVTRTLDAINAAVPNDSKILTFEEEEPLEVFAYEETYYNFGTTMYLQSNANPASAKYPKQGGGLGFFISSDARDGYYVLVETTSSAASSNQKNIRIVKMKDCVLKTIVDSQKTDYTTLSGIFANQSYNIDVKVKVLDYKIYIDAYINGFKISATDEATYINGRLIEPETGVSLICHLPNTTTLYDYVYGLNMTKPQYEYSKLNKNTYQGQFSNDLLSTSFGDIIYNSNSQEDNINQTSMDEFGTVVREIAKVNIKFDSRPAYPIKWTTGMNSFAKILGSKISNFGGEAYVLNNTSTTIPLADNGFNNFYIFGNTLGQSGQLEYSTDQSEEYAVKEPVIFESKWLQSLSDVESLAKWIKTQIINKGKIVDMNIFGNPLISIGDIVSVKYPYQGFEGTEKLIVTNVSHSYNNGLETVVNCRTL